MRKAVFGLLAAVVVGALLLGHGASQVILQMPRLATTIANCGMQLGGIPIFCEPFDVVNPGTPSRTGGLDPNVWGVSRLSQYVNIGQANYNVSPSVHIQDCT